VICARFPPQEGKLSNCSVGDRGTSVLQIVDAAVLSVSILAAENGGLCGTAPGKLLFPFRLLVAAWVCLPACLLMVDSGTAAFGFTPAESRRLPVRSSDGLAPIAIIRNLPAIAILAGREVAFHQARGATRALSSAALTLTHLPQPAHCPARRLRRCGSC